MKIRRTAAALTSAAALSVTGVAMATPAQAAPVITGGLVNVTITDLQILNDSINNNNVLNDVLNDNQINLGVAAVVIAQVCDVQVGVLATLVQTGTTTCAADGGTLTLTQVTG